MIRKWVIKLSILGTTVPVVYFSCKDTAIERFIRTLSLGLTNVLDYKYQFFMRDEKDPNYEKNLKDCHIRCANRILNGCLKNEGLYVKLGQGLSAMNHVLPKEYITILSSLHDKALPHSYEKVEKLFLEELGNKPKNIFKEFDDKAFAAASLAQVHKAISHDNEHLAVKVQYYDLKKRFYGDIRTIEILLDIVKFVFPDFGFAWVFKDLKGTLQKELDFSQEADNGRKCAQDLAKFKQVRIPRIYSQYSSERILTTEFIDGVKIDDISTLKSWKIDLKRLDELLVEIFNHQIFHTGFVHADPHPGNLLITHNTGDDSFQLIILDHGLYQTVERNDRLNLASFVSSIIQRDFKNSQKYAELLHVDDWEILGEIVLQHPLYIDKSTQLKLHSKLTKEDIKYMQKVAAQHFDRIMDTLKKMPRSLLLFIRNLNLTRAICREHGDVINRYTYMADSTLRALYQVRIQQNWFLGHLELNATLIYHRFMLRIQMLREFLSSVYISLMNKVGLGPPIETIRQIYHEAAIQ